LIDVLMKAIETVCRLHRDRLFSLMQAATATAICQVCAFWKNSEPTQGECHRHAPQAIVFNVDGSLKFESRFPQTAAEDWCGDFSAK
jgi:hypothetical protein